MNNLLDRLAYAITSYNKKGAVEVLKNTSSRPVGYAIKDGSFDAIIRNNEENVNTFDKNFLDEDVKHSRRLVSNKGMSRSIDDTIQMLSVLEGAEETHQVKVSKEKLIES